MSKKSLIPPPKTHHDDDDDLTYVMRFSRDLTAFWYASRLTGISKLARLACFFIVCFSWFNTHILLHVVFTFILSTWIDWTNNSSIFSILLPPQHCVSLSGVFQSEETIHARLRLFSSLQIWFSLESTKKQKNISNKKWETDAEASPHTFLELVNSSALLS